jgi:hypothetical protein
MVAVRECLHGHHNMLPAKVIAAVSTMFLVSVLMGFLPVTWAHATNGLESSAKSMDSEPTLGAEKPCSDLVTPSDQDMMPILSLGWARGEKKLFLFMSTVSPDYQFQGVYWCETRGGLDNWGGTTHAHDSLGPLARPSIAADFSVPFVFTVWENHGLLPEAALDMNIYGNQSIDLLVDHFSKGIYPSAGFLGSTPRLPFVVFQRDRTDGGSSILFSRPDDLAGIYKSWMAPHVVIGAVEPGIGLNETPAAASDPSNRIHIAYLRSNSTEPRAVYYIKNLNGGENASWEPEPGRRISWVATVNHDVAIAASKEGNTILVVWTATKAGNDDLMYAYSLDGGSTFSNALNLSATAYNEGYPAIFVDPDTSTFHVAYWRGDSIPGRTNNILYTQASWGDPSNWTTPLSVLDAGAVASAAFPKPAIASYTYKGNHSVKVAWTDERNVSNLDIYLNSVNPMSCGITADPISVPPGFPVSFSATASGGTSPYIYFWRFGDGATDSGAATSHPYGSPGEYNAVLRVDDAVGNTCFDAVRIHVLPPVPDLAISSADISFSPDSPFTEGTAVLVNATVHNIGGAASGVTVARFHDGMLPSPQIGGDQGVPPIPFNDEASVSVTWIASSPGPHDVCVVVDPDNLLAELNETNNVACAPVQLLSRPDLRPTFLGLSPHPPVLDGTVTRLNATVANEGDGSAGQFDVLLFDDENGNGQPDGGERIGSIFLLGLAGHSEQNVSVPWIPTPPGDHKVCAYADPPPGAVGESNETNNVACIDVIVLPGPATRPDYIPILPEPQSPIRVGFSSPVSLAIVVHNQGNSTAINDSTLAFYEATTPASPFASFKVSPVAQGDNSSRFTATWMSPAIPGMYGVMADVDHENNVTEWDETNNVYAWTIQVVGGPLTSLVIGDPNYTDMMTYISPLTLLDFSVIDQSGTGIRNTTYRIDSGAWENYTAKGAFNLSGEGNHYLEWCSTDYAGNVEGISSVVLRLDGMPPITALSLGDPSYLVGGNFVNSSTPISLQAIDGGATPVGFDYTGYRIDGGSWGVYSSPFHLLIEGSHTVDFFSSDKLLNLETQRSVTVVVDNTPPVTSLVIDGPEYSSIDIFVSSITEFYMTAVDGGNPAAGLNLTSYRVWNLTWSSWIAYSQPLTLGGADGLRFVEYRSFDLLGNVEEKGNITVNLDDTPPVTNITQSGVGVTTETVFTLAATDSGCGVNVTRYRIDGGNWITYLGGFTLPKGEHNITYYSNDMLNNTESERWLVVTVEGTTTPPEVAVNYKPVMAVIFAIILLVAGVWSSKRKPWKGGKDRMAVVKAFEITSMPFVIAEAATGVLSLAFEPLRIPPSVGWGTGVDNFILVTGLVLSFLRPFEKVARTEDHDGSAL